MTELYKIKIEGHKSRVYQSKKAYEHWWPKLVAQYHEVYSLRSFRFEGGQWTLINSKAKKAPKEISYAEQHPYLPAVVEKIDEAMNNLMDCVEVFEGTKKFFEYGNQLRAIVHMLDRSNALTRMVLSGSVEGDVDKKVEEYLRFSGQIPKSVKDLPR